MKKIIVRVILIAFAILNCSVSYANSTEMIDDIKMQNHISDIGFKLLNANKIDKRMAFVYKKKDAKIKSESGLTKRQIVIYKSRINYASDDSEIAALLAREICKTAESYTGPIQGLVSSVQVKMAPKKYEMLFDKRAVDFLVKAGYNPVALITFINKSDPQKRFDRISNHNLTSKRLANIYEYIYFQYPQFLYNNEYLHNEAYQNFLLTSIENRRKLKQKVEKGSKERINYE